MRDPRDELSEIEEAGLRRTLRPIHSPQAAVIDGEDGRRWLNFSSNDYLGLANDASLVATFQENLGRHGAGAGASRLICGTLAPHVELEEHLAAFKRSEAALTFSSGYATATGTIPALCQKGDFIILDKLCHASLIDGSRLSGATIRVFPHDDLGKLDHHLRWARERAGDDARILVVTESVFSMDGDRASLSEIVELKERHGALLLVDEAHAFGILGPGGRGLGSELRIDNRIDLSMGTFSKAGGLSGGYLCSSRNVIDLLVNRARSFIYSTAPSPALAATISASLSRIEGPDGEERRRRLWRNLRLIAPEPSSAILPFVIGENDATLAAAGELAREGFFVPAIRFPTVPRGTARLRVTISASHASEDVAKLATTLSSLRKKVTERELPVR